jgi:hypothetical protein
MSSSSGAVEESVLKMIRAKGFRLIRSGVCIGLLTSIALTLRKATKDVNATSTIT